MQWHYFSGDTEDQNHLHMNYIEGYYQPLILTVYDLVGRFRNSKDVRNLLSQIAGKQMSIKEGVEALQDINSDLKRKCNSSAAAATQQYPASEGTVHHLLAELSTTVYLLSGAAELVEILDFASKGGDADKVEEALLMWTRLSNENKDTSASLVPIRDIGRRG